MVSRLRIIADGKSAELFLQRTSAGLSEYLAMLTRQSAEETRDLERDNAPVGVAGEMGAGLKGSIDIDYGNRGLSATVAPNSSVRYAEAVELGSRPHMPPAFPGSALESWARMKGISVWAVAMSIARHGTRPHPFVQPTREAMASRVPAIFSEGISRYLTRVRV